MSERRLTIDGVEIHDGGDCYVIARSATTIRATSSRRSELIDAAKDAAPTRSSCRSARTARSTRASSSSSRTTTSSASGARTASTARRSSSARRVPRAAGARARASASRSSRRRSTFESADFLAELDVPAFKFASGDIRNTPLLRHVAAFGKPMLLSTGGADAGGRRARGRRDPAAQRAALHPAVHGRVSGRHGRPEPRTSSRRCASASRSS